MIKYKLVLLSILFCASWSIQAQVTLGSNQKSERGALLDLKSQAASTANETSASGGLLLPRVALVNETTLEPFVSTSDAQWTNATQKSTLMREHTGLEVYNVGNINGLKPGAYVWNGTRWEQLFKEVVEREPQRIVFPLPAFNLPLINQNNPENKRLQVDLYQVYLNNMHVNYFITNLPNKGTFLAANRYNSNELDYVVTHYDKRIITIHGISNSGIMDYTVHNINPDASSFLNIYLVVHKGKEKQ